jgi:hypothetical protein
MIFGSLLLLIASSLVTTSAQDEEPMYAGYYLFFDTMYAYEGVLGDIMTIGPYVPPNVTGFAEWVTIVLSYDPEYWMQTGYVNCSDTSYQLRYYYERLDAIRYECIYSATGPSSGSWHTYYFLHPYGYGGSNNETRWNCYRDGVLRLSWYVRPYNAIDQMSFVETLSTTIDIDGSHFKRLSYFDFDKDWHWVRWDTHYPYHTGPYSLTEISDYEFNATGGG